MNNNDQDLKETLSSVDANVFTRIFSSEDTFGLEKARRKQPGDGDSDEDDEDDEDTSARIPVIPTVHAKDAVDYSDFDDAVPDDLTEKYYRRGMGMVQKNLPKSRLALVTDNYDDSEEEEQEEEEGGNKEALASSQQQQPTDTATTTQDISLSTSTSSLAERDDKATNEVDIKQLYPGFERNKILKFSELFMAKIKRPPKLVPHKRGKMRRNEVIYECCY